MEDTKRRSAIRKAALLLAPVLVIGAVFFALRGPKISNLLKQEILPELEIMLGQKVGAQNIYLNIFPLFIEAKGMSVSDEKGGRLLAVKRVKAYVELTGLFDKRITIRRLVIREPVVSLGRKKAEEISGNVRRYLETTRKDALKVKVRAVEIQKGEADLVDDSAAATAVSVRGFSGEAILGDAVRVIASAENFVLKKEGLPEISAGITAGLLVRDGAIEIRKLTIDSFGSRVAATGEYGGEKGRLRTDLSLMFESLRKLFHLQKSGEGSVSSHGLVSISKGAVSVDLDVEGDFFIQTLMELLKVKEKIEGRVILKGHVSGPLDRLVAKGTGELREGNLFDVNVDQLKCGISYEDGTMRFSGGSGRLYNGTATLEASIALPVVDRYSLDVGFSNVDSKAVFKLIGWDPGVMPGKVKGTLFNSGSSFNPEGVFEYRSGSTGKNVLGRVRDVSGRYSMKDDLVTITDLKLSTGLSSGEMNGTADLGSKRLDFGGSLKTSDLADATGPYYSTVHGAAEFRGRIAGQFSDPEIRGRIDVVRPAIGSYSADRLQADVRYRKDLATIENLTASGREDNYSMNGTIRFKGASDLFDFREPGYDLKASITRADLKKFAAIFYKDFQGSGTLRTDLTIRGRGEEPRLSGEGFVEGGLLYGFPFESASFGWDYGDQGFILSPLKIKKGKSLLSGELKVDSGGRFEVSATSERLYLSDLLNTRIRGDALLTLKADGHGTPDRHTINIKAGIIEGRLRDRAVGSGTVSAVIRDKALTFSASLLDDKVLVSGSGRMEKEFPWKAAVEIKPGRYDTVISAFLTEVPEDLILSMSGDISLSGDRRHVSASSSVRQVNLSMYGYSFTNEKDIRLELADRRLGFDHITLRSGNALVRIDGSLDIGKAYNLSVDGSTSLSPFKSLSTKIGILKGDAEFDLDITGDWENPSVNGKVSLTNGSVSLKDYSYRLSGLGGSLYLDNDRVVLENLRGKLGGGDVGLSGILYLKKFTVRRFFIEAAVDNISAAGSPDFSANFSGNLLYKGTPEDQMISGDIRINRARYRERVEWKSWLLKTKQPEKVRAEVSQVEKARLNVHVVGKENIRIDNNIARADISADLLLRGTLYRPAVLGRLESREGTVYFRNNEFRILRASADFTDEARLNPVISIAAETIVKGYKIKMNLEGRMNQFAMSLSSDPVLKEMDILALLTVGQTGGQLKGLEGGVGAGEATSFVTGKLQDVVEERLRSITGLDRFQVDPHVSKITGTVEPRVTVSKRLLGDKVFVTYTSATGAEEEQILKVEYFVNRSVSLVGIKDERGILGGDIKFRFEFK